LEKKTASSLRFVMNWPGHMRTPQIISNVVEDLLALNDLEGAIKTSRMIIQLQPQPPEQLMAKAWQTIANAKFDLKRYAEAETAIDTVLLFPSVKGKIRIQFSDRLAATIYRQAEQLNQKGLKAEAAQEFLRLGSKLPNAAIKINADYDAGTLFLELQQWNLAISLFEGLRLHFPQHELTRTLPPKLALAYENTEQWQRASEELETIASQNPDPKSDETRQAIWLAATYQDKAKNGDQAIRLYKKYVWAYPRPLPQKVEGQFRLVQLYQEKRIDTKRIFWLRGLIKSYDQGGDENSDRTQYLAAYAAFTLAEPGYKHFKTIALTLPLKRSLKKKKKAMNAALKSYIKTTEIGVSEFTTAGTFRIGDIYLTLAADLLASQRPKGLSNLELEQYEILLEEQALPFEDQAIEILESNAQLTLEDIYDEWVKKSFVALSNLLPGRYAKQEQIEPYVETIY
ncbi:MAG: hypothetical protein JKY67_14700, partial [Pseudomonadales bacterium]|nr:hypothetical protein [Pseudomonadales bacterium]